MAQLSTLVALHVHKYTLLLVVALRAAPRAFSLQGLQSQCSLVLGLVFLSFFHTVYLMRFVAACTANCFFESLLLLLDLGEGLFVQL